MVRRILVVSLVLVATASCVKMYPRKVGSAVARLTTRAAVMISAFAGDDTNCGFSSQAVIDSFAIEEGNVGQRGVVTYTVTDCVMDFGPERKDWGRDCNGLIYLMSGKVTFSGTKKVGGTLTGSMEVPVIPDAADTVQIEITAKLENFDIVFSTSENSMKIVSGNIDFKAEPHLAVSQSTGLCTIATADLILKEIHLIDAEVEVRSPKRDFTAKVKSSNFDAQVGTWKNEQNALNGQITVWNSTVPVPNKTDDLMVLDTEFDLQTHVDSFSCKDDLVTPYTYECGSIKPALAQGVSQLTIAIFGTLVSAVDADTRCGFSSPSVEASPMLDGTLGQNFGTATWTVTDCVVDFGGPTVVSTDCQGATKSLHGPVRVSGTKRIVGILSGDPTEPVIPTTMNPAEITLRAEFIGPQEFGISDSVTTNILNIQQGALSGIMRPRTGKDLTTGVCSISVPVVEFEAVAWEPGSTVTLFSAFGIFDLAVDGSQLDAQNGTNGAVSNYLAGRITVDGDDYPIPAPGLPPLLDPAFDQAAFDASYQCAPNLRVVSSDAECSLYPFLGENAARLLVEATGRIVSMINADTTCGFEAQSVQLSPSEVIGSDGQMGSLSWDISGCDLGSDQLELEGRDCNRNYTYVQGRAQVNASRTVRGLRETILGFIESITPKSRDAIDIELTLSNITEFSTWSIPALGQDPTAKLTIHAGTLNATMHPILGENSGDLGTFDIATPVADFESIEWLNVAATLESDNKTFTLNIARANLTAFNGGWQGVSNTISGDIVVNGEVVLIKPMALDPAFEQLQFDSTYDCTLDLLETIPPN